PSEVFLKQGDNRSEAIHDLLAQFKVEAFTKKQVALKPNYNSADPFPAQTHPETLRCLINELQTAGVSDLILGDRSGMGKTSYVLAKSGVTELAQKMKFKIQVLDDLPVSGWVHCDVEDSHWSRGFLIARMFIDAEIIVQTCCLKTHQFGGHFTLSLKNSVGMVARYNPQDGYDYMGELHGSPTQREMIAEVNTAYEPNLILMDGSKAFVKGGPAMGREVTPNILLASKDRVAIDAVGVAILRHFGTTNEVERGPIFELTQLARAIELGLGASSLHDIKLVPLDSASEQIAESILMQFAK
ncbi:MAG: DUF362 domain-containing protein, partial [Candidatus Thorarchaeota archaeon]